MGLVTELTIAGLTATTTMFGATVTLWARGQGRHTDKHGTPSEPMWLPGLWAAFSLVASGGLLALLHINTKAKKSESRFTSSDVMYGAATATISAVMASLLTATMLPTGVLRGQEQQTILQALFAVGLVTCLAFAVRRYGCRLCTNN